MLFQKVGEKEDKLLLADPSGRRAAFSFLEMIIVDGQAYAALIQEEEDEVVILRFEEMQKGGEVYETIDDDALFEKVCHAFSEEFGDEFEF